MNLSPVPFIILALISLTLSGCETHAEAQPHHEEHKVVVTSPKAQDVVITQQYVCQIHSRRHIEVCALVGGYLDEILVKEGQAVKRGDLMFKILPTLYKAELDAKLAEVRTAHVELEQSRNLFRDKVVSQVDVTLHEAKLASAQAEAQRAQAELNFTDVRAPFDGIVDRLHEQLGSLIEEGDMLTTLSDNSVMWVYFNVPEADYLEYMANRKTDPDEKKVEKTIDEKRLEDVSLVKDVSLEKKGKDVSLEDDVERDEISGGQSQRVELVLANGAKFPQIARGVRIEAQFNNETGNIKFRADFPNPKSLLRHGQTGTVLIHQTMPNAVIIPQRAVFEILAKRYVYVVGEDDVVHPREIVVKNELEDIFVIGSGLDVNDKIVLEGIRQVTDGDTVEYEFLAPEEVLSNLKYHAE